MNYSEIFLLAVALSIDACLVSFAYGTNTKLNKIKNSLKLAVTTGLFQGFMPVIGYIFADKIKTFISPYSKYIVFMIFMYLGVTFILSSLKKESVKNKPNLGFNTLMVIGIATSIDAFSAGITLLLTNSPIILSILLIGVVTFIDSLFGFWSAYSLKQFNKKGFEISGGVIMIFLAVKALF